MDSVPHSTTQPFGLHKPQPLENGISSINILQEFGTCLTVTEHQIDQPLNYIQRVEEK